MLDEVGITLNEKRFQPDSSLIPNVLVVVFVDTGAGVVVGAGVGVGVVKMPLLPTPLPPLGGA
jgi:hypothetical protein